MAITRQGRAVHYGRTIRSGDHVYPNREGCMDIMEKIKTRFFQSVVRGYFLSLVVLATALVASCGDSDESSAEDDASTTESAKEFRPVVFVHGGFGWASQFESQAQRFMSNGYPREYLAAYEHNTGPDSPPPEEQTDGLDEVIDAVLAETDAEQVDLIAHSRGGGVCFYYLEGSEERAAKVAHYVVVDSGTGLTLTTGMTRTPGNVETLALWGEGDPNRKVDGDKATNVSFPDQSHVQMPTAATSFVEMYKFFNGEDPETDRVVEATGEEVEIAGKVNYFPENTGALGTLEIYEVDSDTGYRVTDEPVDTWDIDKSGKWGPVNVKKGATYEFAFEHDDGVKHYIYREPFLADDYFVHLVTSPPGGFVAVLMTRTPDNVDILIQRDKEFWGDQGDDNDILTVDGTNVATPEAAARDNNLIGLFLMDWGPGAHPDLEDPSTMDYGDSKLGESNLDAPIASFAVLPFMSGLDLFIPAASPPDRTIEVKLIPRGGDGAEQVINVPNWPSDEVRVSVVFRDFVQ